MNGKRGEGVCQSGGGTQYRVILAEDLGRRLALHRSTTSKLCTMPFYSAANAPLP